MWLSINSPIPWIGGVNKIILLFLEFKVTRDAPPSLKINLAPWKLVKLEGQYKYIETERKVAILLVSALSTTQI